MFWAYIQIFDWAKGSGSDCIWTIKRPSGSAWECQPSSAAILVYMLHVYAHPDNSTKANYTSLSYMSLLTIST